MIVNSLLPILTPLTLTDVRVTHQPPHKTVAILLLTKRVLAITASPHLRPRLYLLLLRKASLHSACPIQVVTVCAEARSRDTDSALLETDAVVLLALSIFAVAHSLCYGEYADWI